MTYEYSITGGFRGFTHRYETSIKELGLFAQEEETDLFYKDRNNPVFLIIFNLDFQVLITDIFNLVKDLENVVYYLR